MDALLAAIYGKISGSALSSDVGGRVYLDEAPAGCEFPYVVFFIVSGVPDNVFNKYGESVTIQFSLFSDSAGAAEITDMFNDLTAIYDDAQLTVTGYNMIIMERQNLVTMVEEIETTEGKQAVKHWAVDYEAIIQKS